MRILLVVLILFSVRSVSGAQHDTWKAYMKANRYKCPGPMDTLKTPVALKLGDKPYRHLGSKLVVTRRDDDRAVKIGVISAIKDVTKNTRHNIKQALKWFKEEKVEWLVVNGDLALEEFDLEAVVDLLGKSKLPTLVILGNSESRGAWARVYKVRSARFSNLINGVWVRQIVADDVEFWTLPGYHDPKFVHQGAGCHYDEKHVDEMIHHLRPEGSAPVVLVAHGPPQGKGKKALDRVGDGDNVGDKVVNRLISKRRIPFGLFGHILEAGGSAVGADFSTPVPSGHRVDHLYVNAGSLSGDPWTMNDGTVSKGMATVIAIEGGRADYKTKRFEPPKKDEDS